MQKNINLLLSPDGVDGGGASGAGGGTPQGAPDGPPTGSELFGESSTTPAGATTETEATHEPAGGGGAEPAVEAIRSPALTKEDIAELVRSISATRQPAVQEPQANVPPLTEQQLEQIFNVWKPSTDFIAQLRHESPETVVRALTSMRDGMMKQAITMARHYIRQQLESVKSEITGQITPLTEYVSEARANAFRDDFFDANNDLEPYEELVDAVASKLYQAGGDNFLKLDRAGRMKLFADGEQKLVQKLQADGNTTAGANGGRGNGRQAPQASPPARRMSTLTSGGQPGSRGAGGGKPTTGNKHIDDGLAALD